MGPVFTVTGRCPLNAAPLFQANLHRNQIWFIFIFLYQRSYFSLPYLLVVLDWREIGSCKLQLFVTLSFSSFVIDYKVTVGSLDAFSYVQWPEALLKLGNYAKFFQLNLIQIAPIDCFPVSLKMNAYVGLLFTIAFNAGFIALVIAYFQTRKLCIKYEFGFFLCCKHKHDFKPTHLEIVHIFRFAYIFFSISSHC